MPGVEVLPLPIKQYKDYKARSKGERAHQLSEWLVSQKKNGLILRGVFHAHTQIAAAKLGLELIKELPNTHVKRHYDSYRLYFEDEHIDFAQAIALEYYFFAIYFGVLRAGMSLPAESRKLFVAMDRFPGPDTQNTPPGNRIPPTQGSKFLDFVYSYSRTAQGIEAKYRAANLESKFGTIDWWRLDTREAWKKGRPTHISFYLIGWLLLRSLRNFGTTTLSHSRERKTEKRQRLV